MNPRIFWACLILMAGTAVCAQTGVSAVPVGDFLNSLGVCTHIGQGVDNAAQSATALSYIGARNVRDDSSTAHVNDWILLYKQAGVKTVLTSSGPHDDSIASMLEQNRKLAKAGALLALEGPNEPNNWGVTWQGQKSTAGGDFLPVAKWMSEYYKQAKSDTVLQTYPVFHSSEAGGSEPNNVGLQFLTIPQGAGALMPDGTQYADFANIHNYICRKPDIIDNMAWLNADPVFNGWTDGLHCEYGRTWRKGFPGYSNAELVALPRVTTETGWTTGGKGLTQEQQGRLYLAMYLAQFKQGFKHTFMYMLRDDGEGWGFVDRDFKMKTSGEYLHNLTTILADSGASATPGQLGYSIPNQPETVHDLLMQKSNGKFELAVWNERAKNGADKVTLDLGASYPAVAVYEPTGGTAAAQTLANVSSVELTLTGYTVNIVEVTPASSAAAAVPGGVAASKPAEPAMKIDEARLEAYRTKLIEKINAAVKSGKRTGAHLRVINLSGKYPVLGADDKSVTIEFENNAMPVKWTALDLNDRVNLARAFASDYDVESLLIAAAFCFADARNEQAEDYLGKAQVLDAAAVTAFRAGK